ncbi:DJ-1 family glyoxalase III [Leptospira idonii]|uniref:DJ-1/PfpI family protein n=1 Tax=Leptospira idonii TaxID=1193500 RepID=A0A4R9LYL2_9LEPT|nr:DJ-1 family glyoxalase III [Leptospira idonii]TGN19464.1 DJ-1/PfpI family protein [Leptospira idonii]
MSSHVLIPFANGFEEMEGIILADVFRRGNVKVTVASLEKGPVTASRKTVHIADQTLEEAAKEDFDMIVLPGGLEGTKNLQSSSLLKEILENHNKQGKQIAAICAAPNVLRNWGFLSGDDPFTAFPSSLSLGTGGNYKEERIVSHNNIYTSLGPGSAFEFALFLLERLEGREIKEQVEKNLYLP